MTTGKPSWMARGLGLLSACLLAVSPLVQAADEPENDDPWEGYNRVVFTFNDTLDTYALKPIAEGYQYVAPQFVEDGVHNFFNNIGDIGNLINNLLQGKLEAAGSDTSRFLLNSTLGVFGFVDVATKMGLNRNDEDFGQTLGSWGVPRGPYFVIPFLGPSTVRNAVGRIPDAFTKPYPYMDNISFRNELFFTGIIDLRASLLSADKLITGDKYTFIRNAYLQNSEFKAKDGQVIDDF